MESSERDSHNNSALERSDITTFTPIKILPPIQTKNLTGKARHVYDLTVNIYENIKQWDNLYLQGVIHVKNIIQEKQDDSYSDYLQKLCDELEKVCDGLDQVIKNLDQIRYQLNAFIALEKGRPKLFLTWPTTKFGDVMETIYMTYYEETKQKREVLENVAHNHTKSWKMRYLAAWIHQPKHLNIIVESLLTETGYRTII